MLDYFRRWIVLNVFLTTINSEVTSFLLNNICSYKSSEKDSCGIMSWALNSFSCKVSSRIIDVNLSLIFFASAYDFTHCWKKFIHDRKKSIHFEIILPLKLSMPFHYLRQLELLVFFFVEYLPRILLRQRFPISKALSSYSSKLSHILAISSIRD